MGIGDLINNVVVRLKEKKAEREYDDNETRDRYLKSLRRQRRVQLEEVEKIRLKKEIEEHNKARSRRYMFGVKHHHDPFECDDDKPAHLIESRQPRLNRRKGYRLNSKYNIRGGGML